MRYSRLRPRTCAGAVFLRRVPLRLILALVLATCCLPSAASLDVVDWLSPGDPSDVLAAGLALPGEFALYPDVTRPTSLLHYPSSLTARAQASYPWQVRGRDPRFLGGSSLSAVVNLRGSIRGITTAAAGSLGHSALRFTENGNQYTRLGAGQDDSELGVAAGAAKTRLGLSLVRSRSHLNMDSTSLAGIETVSGSGIGFISSSPLQTTGAIEATRDLGSFRVGLLASWADGSLDLRTTAKGQSYSAYGDTKTSRIAPYLIYRGKSTADMLLFDRCGEDVDGPVLVGRILAGSWTGQWKSSSAAFAHLSRGAHSKQLYSLQYSEMQVGLSGTAGGFLFPGLFSSVYHTDDSFSLGQLTARCGFERTRGKTAVRWSIMLARCKPSGSTYLTQAKWLQPLRVLSDERLRDMTAWVLSPSIGMGYTKGNTHIDAGLSLYAAVLCKQEQKHKGATAPAAEAGSRNRTLPGYRWGITVRREF